MLREVSECQAYSASRNAGHRDRRTPGAASADLALYRDAVNDLVGEARAFERPEDAGELGERLAARLTEPELAQVLDLVPGGVDAGTTGLLRELHRFRPGGRSSASDVPSLVRIFLLSQIDAVWWGGLPPYDTDNDVTASSDLVDLGPLRSRQMLGFQYRSRPEGVLGRVVDWAASRALPAKWPRPGDLRFTRTRPEAIAFLNRLAVEVADATAAATPPLWVTSLVRSVQHQHRLRALGFAALIPSSHCVGYGIDIELQWFRQFDPKGALPALLLEHQGEGEANVINEGPAWHVCLNPACCPELGRDYGEKLNEMSETHGPNARRAGSF